MKNHLLIILSACLSCSVFPLHADEESIHVKVVGTLRTGLFAIGGETTGSTITAKGITWELEFGTNAAFRARAKKLDGKRVIVEGSLSRKAEVEIRERRIVAVSSLAPHKAGPAAVDGPGASLRRPVEAKTKRAGSRVTITEREDSTVLEITSPAGIDEATITRTNATWPEVLLIRLHLKGLESLRLDHPEHQIEWSVASTGNHDSRTTLRAKGREIHLDRASPYFSPVRIIGGKRKIPLEAGCFEVRIPSRVLTENPDTLTLRWVDFYR